MTTFKMNKFRTILIILAVTSAAMTMQQGISVVFDWAREIVSELGYDDEERLLIDLFRGYNSLIRPVRNVSSPPIEVALGMAMILLINIVRQLLCKFI